MNDKDWPFVSILIPTYNAEKHIERCLASLDKQTYPRDRNEVIVADGGSSDRTVEIVNQYGSVTVVQNIKRDAEIGKVVALQHSRGEIVALLDADNEIVQEDWLEKVVFPLVDDESLLGTDSDILVKKGDYIANRYCTLLRLEDPLVRCMAMLKRNSSCEVKDSYTVRVIKPGRFPVFGACGFVWRKSALLAIGAYEAESFDEADFAVLVVDKGWNRIGNVEGCGMYHHHIETIGDFVRKRIRRGNEVIARRQRKQNAGQSLWVDRYGKLEFFVSVVFCVTVVGPLLESLVGFAQTRDVAWLLHPLTSLLTVVIYGAIYIRDVLPKLS